VFSQAEHAPKIARECILAQAVGEYLPAVASASVFKCGTGATRNKFLRMHRVIWASARTVGAQRILDRANAGPPHASAPAADRRLDGDCGFGDGFSIN